MLNPYCLPALFALGLKILLLAATRVSPLRDRESRVFLAFLFILALHNVAEIMALNYSGPKVGIIPLESGYLYFTMGTIAMALLLHLMLVRLNTTTGWNVPVEALKRWLYVPMVAVIAMLWGTHSMIKGFVPHGFSYTRVPGPLYIWFELYALVYLLVSFCLLCLSTVYSSNGTHRRKNVLTLIGMAPMIILPIVVIVLQSVDINSFTAPLWFPLAMTFFLVVTAYAIYEHRLFNILFYLPGTPLHRRRTAFHQRIKSFISELDRLPSMSVEEALSRLAATLKCNVALVGAGREPLEAEPLSAEVGHLDFEHLTEGRLKSIDEIVLTKELKQRDPQVYSALSGANCAAVIPFRPFNGMSAGWLLLGGRKQAPDELPMDFTMVESLFDRMGDLFLDNMVREREQLNALQTEVGHLASANENLKAELQRKQNAIDALYGQVAGATSGACGAVTLDELTSGLERKVICDTLARTKGNVSATAKSLGLTRQTLYSRMENYGIDTKQWRKRQRKE